uniref:Uncharacterized protein n=1 Tax=Anguilla anguilla TaxID=7936 RepID=A0A0E9QMP1_ANGAN
MLELYCGDKEKVKKWSCLLCLESVMDKKE